jgi:hypothetical protein
MVTLLNRRSRVLVRRGMGDARPRMMVLSRMPVNEQYRIASPNDLIHVSAVLSH